MEKRHQESNHLTGAEQENSTTFLTARHSKKGAGSEEYPGLTPEGVELVKEKTKKDILELIENSEPGSVIVFGGATDLIRTKSTTRVSANEIKEVLAGREEEFLILDEADINNLLTDEEKKSASTIIRISEIVAANPDKKIIITFPLAMSEMSMLEKTKGRFAGKPEWKSGGAKETRSPYLTEIMKRNNNDEALVVMDWIRSNGEITSQDEQVLRGPNALEVAKGYVHSLQRLEGVTKKMFSGRPLVIEITAHSWEIDVMVDYLAHNGTVTPEGFEEIAKGTGDKPTIISEFEFSVIKIQDGKGTMTYRGKTYEFDPSLLNN
jgi:hypothetical protein